MTEWTTQSWKFQRQVGLGRRKWKNQVIDNEGNPPSPRLAREGKCSVARRGNVATLRLVTNRWKPSFANRTKVYVVFMDEMTERSRAVPSDCALKAAMVRLVDRGEIFPDRRFVCRRLFGLQASEGVRGRWWPKEAGVVEGERSQGRLRTLPGPTTETARVFRTPPRTAGDEAADVRCPAL